MDKLAMVPNGPPTRVLSVILVTPSRSGNNNSRGEIPGVPEGKQMSKFKYEIGEYVVQASRASFQERTREQNLATRGLYVPPVMVANPETFEVVARILIESKYSKGEQKREYGVRSMNMSFGGVVNVPEDDLMSLDEYRTVMKLDDEQLLAKVEYQASQTYANLANQLSNIKPTKPPTFFGRLKN